MEEWRDVVGFEDFYEVSSFGRVKRKPGYISGRFKGSKSFLRGRILKPSADSYGYLIVGLSCFGISKTKTVHRLVALSFLKNHKKLRAVNHIDGNKQNNCVSNLEWCSNKENTQHALKLGLLSPPFGELSGSSKLTKERVLLIREMFKFSEEDRVKKGISPKSKNRAFPQVWLAKCFKVDKTNIRDIIHGRTWKHI